MLQAQLLNFRKTTQRRNDTKRNAGVWKGFTGAKMRTGGTSVVSGRGSAVLQVRRAQLWAGVRDRLKTASSSGLPRQPRSKSVPSQQSKDAVAPAMKAPAAVVVLRDNADYVPVAKMANARHVETARPTALYSGALAERELINWVSIIGLGKAVKNERGKLVWDLRPATATVMQAAHVFANHPTIVNVCTRRPTGKTETNLGSLPGRGIVETPHKVQVTPKFQKKHPVMTRILQETSAHAKRSRWQISLPQHQVGDVSVTESNVGPMKKKRRTKVAETIVNGISDVQAFLKSVRSLRTPGFGLSKVPVS